MLVPIKPILDRARAEGYGVPAFNVFNMETVRAVAEAAEEVRSPAIIQCSETFGQDLEAVGELVRFYARRHSSVPIALHLDHGRTFEAAVRAIRAGYTSVMVDRSKLSFEDNVRETAEIVKLAHAVGVSVEGEIGHVGRGVTYEADRNAGLTSPESAVEYVRQTGIDCVAIAIGTAHGRYVGKPYLDFELLSEIRKSVEVPLVLHGGSSTGDDNLRRAVQLGITKINIYTDLSTAGAQAVKKYLEEEEYPNLVYVFNAGESGYKDMVRHYFNLFGSAGRA